MMKKNTPVRLADLTNAEVLTWRLAQQSRNWLHAMQDGRPGYAAVLLHRMSATRKRMKALSAPCCQPHETARHTANCPTVVHAAIGDLTACGAAGPVGRKVTCDRCLGRDPKEGWSVYPGVLGPLSARQYENAVLEAREWLSENVDPEEPEANWQVWNLLNANYEGGVSAFIDDNPPFPAAL